MWNSEFRERARRAPNLIRDTNGTECESIPVDPDEIDLESLEEGDNSTFKFCNHHHLSTLPCVSEECTDHSETISNI